MKSVIITGAAKGIGLSCVKYFDAKGFKVFALDTDDEGLKYLKNERSHIEAISCDVANEIDVSRAFDHIAKLSDQINYLINNAGIQRYGHIVDTTPGMWDEVMNVNLKSAFLCSQASIPLMQKSGGGVIINVSSVQAFITQKNVAAYSTSKSALLGLTRSIAVDFAPSIRCLAVCPGTVDTPMLRFTLEQAKDPKALMEECKNMHLTQDIGKPEDIAALIGFLCSDDARFMTGQAIRIDGGLGITISGSPE